ncbi:LGFP repeat protein [Kribbella flavida DSM 17836]|uniref:LGFP repeat protein n=1 Tax=Kribbella flavida (strain DSM 17836 / JCM 10339 / NBRC 14399) TaxID=479435 RepID=D2PKI7_KRIFD|nr:N-acetylmuramoyl-L-alanine amidase [Kribbella flavida]ADB30499.1 LGFP repeat protein [Kribbella flavida DSM 17836]
MRATRSLRLTLTAVTGLALFVPLVRTPWSDPAPAGAAPRSEYAVEPSYQELPLQPSSGARISSAVARTRQFGMVGVTWPYRKSSARVEAKIRVQRNGSWTAWQRLPVEDEHGPGDSEGRPRSGTEPLWVGSAEGVQAAVTATDGTQVTDAKVVLIQPGARATDAAPPPARETEQVPGRDAGRAPYPIPRIIGRPGWGADERLRAHNGAACAKPKYTSTVQAAFVHHTADRSDYTSAQVPAMIRAMYTYHVKSRGWCDLGYNFLVDRFGRTWEGRYGGMQLPVLGAHTSAFNANSFGVSLIGNFEQAVPTTSMLEATARVIAWKLDANYRSPVSTVVLAGSRLNTVSGHRDAKATACPGNNLYSRLGWLRQRAHALMGKSISTEIYQYAQQLGGYRAIGQPFWGEHPTRTGRATHFGVRDIYWSARTGAHSVHGGFRSRFRQIGPDSPLGLPVGEQRNGKVSGSRVQPFLNGAIYWSPRTGMFPVAGLISRKYGALGAEGSWLGLPTSGAYQVNGGVQQRFEHGRLTASTRTQQVYVS